MLELVDLSQAIIQPVARMAEDEVCLWSEHPLLVELYEGCFEENRSDRRIKILFSGRTGFLESLADLIRRPARAENKHERRPPACPVFRR